MRIIESFFQLFLAVSLATATGYGISNYFAIRSLRPQRLVLAPVFGFLWIIAGVPMFSAITTLSFTKTVAAVLSAGCGLSFFTVFKRYREVGARSFWLENKLELQQIPVIPVLMSILTFQSSSFIQGFRNYWGTVNPDFLQSWSFLDSLNKYSLNFYETSSVSREINLFSSYFPDQLQARFGGTAFGGALQLLGIRDSKTALIATISTGFVVLIMATSTYFKQLFGDPLQYKVAIYAFSFGAPIGMSFIFTFIGQNSTLFMFPLVLLITHQYLERKMLEKRYALLLGFIFFSSFVSYIPILPILVSLSVLSVSIYLIRNPSKTLFFVKDACRVLLFLVFLFFITWSVTQKILKGYLSLISVLDVSDTNVIYFNEWHTWTAFPYFLGFSTSPISNSYLLFLPGLVPILIWIAIFFSVLIVFGLVTYSLSHIKNDTTILAGTIVALGLIIYYSRFLEYGYAEFKLSSWFYFLIPVGLAQLVSKEKKLWVHPKSRYGFFSLVVIFMAFNIFNAIEYSVKALGNDSLRGTIVNSYGLSSSDASMQAIELFMKRNGKGQEVALGLPFIEAEIISARLRNWTSSVTLLSHQALPLDDKYLPGLDGYYKDLAGVNRTANLSLRPSANPSWIILPGESNPNIDILQQTIERKATFSTPYYDVYRVSDLESFFVTDRGFSRVVSTNSSASASTGYVRWAYDGFNLLSYFNKASNRAHVISFNLDFDSRILQSHKLEVYLNNDRVDTLELKGSNKINLNLSLKRGGINSVDFRWKTSGCSFDPKNLKSLRWCNYAKISDIRIDAPSLQIVERGERQGVSELRNKSIAFTGFYEDGWFLNNSSIRFNVGESTSSCSIKLLRDGSNPSLLINPEISLITDGQTQLFKIPLGDSRINLKVDKSNKISMYRLLVRYPRGSTDSTDPSLQIPKGSVRFVSILCD